MEEQNRILQQERFTQLFDGGREDGYIWVK